MVGWQIEESKGNFSLGCWLANRERRKSQNLFFLDIERRMPKLWWRGAFFCNQKRKEERNDHLFFRIYTSFPLATRESLVVLLAFPCKVHVCLSLAINTVITDLDVSFMKLFPWLMAIVSCSFFMRVAPY